MIRFISILSFLLLTSFALADELHLYVSPKGDDSAAGTEAEPLATRCASCAKTGL